MYQTNRRVAVLDPPKVSEHALALGIPTNDVQAIIRANMRNLNRMFELYALKDRKQLSQGTNERIG